MQGDQGKKLALGRAPRVNRPHSQLLLGRSKQLLSPSPASAMCSVVTPLYSLHNDSSVAAGKPPACPHPETVTLARGFACIRAHERGSHAREMMSPFEVSGRASAAAVWGLGHACRWWGGGCFLKDFVFQAQPGSVQLPLSSVLPSWSSQWLNACGCKEEGTCPSPGTRTVMGTALRALIPVPGFMLL